MPSEESRFTPRPKHLWVEIQPKDGQRDVGSAYEIYDCDFADDQPVPVFRLRVKDWPQSAADATLKVWFAVNAGDVAPDERRNVRATDRFTVPGLPGVTFQVDTETLSGNRYRVVVTETREPSADVEPLRVQLDPPGQRIEHKHHLGVGITEHFFDYEDQQPTNLEITARSRIISKAISIPEFDVQLPPR
jgi:hypothetical protein